MEWKQTEFVHKCPASTAWSVGLFYSNMYPPNMSTKWIDTDTPENAIYENDKISYTFNEYGFRSDPFYVKTDINILVSGCSLTVGIGIEYEKTWPVLLKRLIEKYTTQTVTVWNIATSGASPDYVVRSIHKVFRTLRPDAVFVYWPPTSRLELPDPNNKFSIWQSRIEDETFPDVLKNPHFLENQQIKNARTLLSSAPQRITNLQYNSEDVFFDTYARDGQHPGEDWHERVAKMYYEQWLLKNDK